MKIIVIHDVNLKRNFKLFFEDNHIILLTFSLIIVSEVKIRMCIIILEILDTIEEKMGTQSKHPKRLVHVNLLLLLFIIN